MPGALAAAPALAAAALVAALWWLATAGPEAYYQLLQEDGLLEWSTVWALALAAFLFARRARLAPTAIQGLAPALLAAFCVFVALEEISWGQRLVGFRPPAFFLERNFQQELNLHNVASGLARKLTLGAFLAGYGVALPLLLREAALRRAAERLGLEAPSFAVAPIFAGAFALHLGYPLPFTGELVELLLGFGLLGAALGAGGLLRSAGSLAAVLGLALVTTLFTFSRAADAERVAAGQLELDALARDFVAVAKERGEAPTGCGVHQRLHTFVREAPAPELRARSFAELATRGRDRERIAYFLDPWNSPYWVRDECAHEGRRSAFLYSFGANRRRDSSAFEISGDDLGVYLVRRPPGDAPGG